MDKKAKYSKLVKERKMCPLCDSLGLTNPSKCADGMYDKTGHIGPWTQWQGNLDADLMVVGQDWGSVGYYIKNQGIEKDTNETNRNICDLLECIGIQITLPNQEQVQRPLFFTNAILCLRSGHGLTGPSPPDGCFENCSSTFLRPQIELVNPKVVVSLGHKAYSSILEAHGKEPHVTMGRAVGEVIPLTGRTSLIPLFHPGNKGTLTRSMEEQKKDWRRVREMLDK